MKAHYLIDKVVRDGWPSLSETQLLALLTNEVVAGRILDKFGSLRGLANQPLEKLLATPGLGEAGVMRLGACYEMSRRVVAQVVELERVGDFYEARDGDAVAVGAVCGLMVRGEKAARAVSVPYFAVGRYVQVLTSSGIVVRIKEEGR